MLKKYVRYAYWDFHSGQSSVLSEQNSPVALEGFKPHRNYVLHHQLSSENT